MTKTIPSAWFIGLILLTALLMELIGSVISVIGLGALFASDWIILTMAVILDIAKVTTVSFIYQYWGEVKRVMRTYMTVAVLVLMTITSAGAFGYLSGAFEKAIQPNREVMLRVDTLKREQASLVAEKQDLITQKQKINQQIAQLPPDYVTSRQRLIRSFKPEQDRIDARLSVVTKRVDELQVEVLKAESENIIADTHTGPITYVSKAFDISMEDSSKYIILLIVAVFDPLAIMLVIAANFLIARRQLGLATVPPIPPEPLKVKPAPEPDDLRPLAEPEVEAPPTKFTVKAKRVVPVPDARLPKAKAVVKPITTLLPEPVTAEPAPPRVLTTPPPELEIKPVEVTIEQPDKVTQGALIEEPVAQLPPQHSMLEAVKVGIEDALFKHGVKTESKKLGYYQKP